MTKPSVVVAPMDAWVVRYVNKLKNMMGLSHWTILMQTKPSSPDALGETEVVHGQHLAQRAVDVGRHEVRPPALELRLGPVPALARHVVVPGVRLGVPLNAVVDARDVEQRQVPQAVEVLEFLLGLRLALGLGDLGEALHRALQPAPQDRDLAKHQQFALRESLSQPRQFVQSTC